MITENIDKKYPQKKQYSDLSAVRAACLFVVKALNKLVEEMNNQVYFDFDQNGLILRATDKESLQRASNKLEHWKEQTSIGILTDSITKEDYKKFIDSDLQSLLRQERAFINVISFDKFLAACEFLEKKGYKEPRQKYEEIQLEKKNFALLMCTKHRYKEIKERIETMLEPLRKVKKKKKITSSIKLASTWDDVDEISTGIQQQKQEKENAIQPLDTIGFQQVSQKQQDGDEQNKNNSQKEQSLEAKNEAQLKKEQLTHEIILLEIEQWLFHIADILQMLEESDKIKKQDEEANFSVQINKQRFSIEDPSQHEGANDTVSIEVGFMQLKILRETLSSQQNKILEKIRQKTDAYLDLILQNKPKEFVNYLFSEMEPEETDYFQVYTLRELVDISLKNIENYQRKPALSSMSTRKKNIISDLKDYIQKFQDDQLVTIENDGNIYNQYFLYGIQKNHKIFAETVDRNEMMYVKVYAQNNYNQNLNNRHSEYENEPLEHFENNNYIQIDQNNLNKIQQTQVTNKNNHYNQNNNNNNSTHHHQQQHHHHHTSHQQHHPQQINNHNVHSGYHNHHHQQQQHHHKNQNHNNNQGTQNNYYLQEVESQLLKAALQFLTTNCNASSILQQYQQLLQQQQQQLQQQQQQQQQPQAQQQEEKAVVQQVDSTSLTPSKNNPNNVEYQNAPYYLKKFQESQLEEVLEQAVKNKVCSNPSCVLVHKVIQINSLKTSENVISQQKEFGILMDKKDYSLKFLLEEGYLFSVYQQVDVALKILKSLNQIHCQKEKRGAHSNLKPTNILLDTSYNVYLSDLGIDCKKNTSYYYSFENTYSNSLIIIKNKLKNQFLPIADQITQAVCDHLRSQSQTNESNVQFHIKASSSEGQFKHAFSQQQNIFLNQLADLQALGLIYYELFTGQSITAENYFLKNHRQYIKRISQESPTQTLKSIFQLIFSLLELQFTSTEEVIPLLQEIYNKF